MFDSFKIKLAKRVFKTLFKDFLKELNEKQINIESNGFSVSDAELDLQGINSKFKGSPYKFASGGISELHFSIPWFNLFSKNITITLRGLSVDLEQQSDTNFTTTYSGGDSLMESQLFESITFSSNSSSVDLGIPEEYLTKDLEPTEEEEYLTKIIQGLMYRLQFQLENLSISISFPQNIKKNILLIHFPTLKYENLTNIPKDSNFPDVYNFKIYCSKFSIQLFEMEKNQQISSLLYENNVIFGDNKKNELSVKFIPGDVESLLIIDWNMPSIHSIFTPTQINILNEILQSLNYAPESNKDQENEKFKQDSFLTVPSPIGSKNSNLFKSIEVEKTNYVNVEFNIKIENNTSFNILYEDYSTKDIWTEFYRHLENEKYSFPKIKKNNLRMITENFNLQYSNVKNDNKIDLSIQNLFLVDQNEDETSTQNLLKFEDSQKEDLHLSVKNNEFTCKLSPVCLLLDLNLIEKLSFLLKSEEEHDIFDDSPLESEILTYEEELMKYIVDLEDFKISIKYQHNEQNYDVLTLNLKKFSFNFKVSWSLLIQSCFIEIEESKDKLISYSRILDIPNEIVVKLDNSETETKLLGNLSSNDLSKSMMINPNGLSVFMTKSNDELLLRSTISIKTDILSAEFNLEKYCKIQLLINQLMKSLTPKSKSQPKKSKKNEREYELQVNIDFDLVDLIVDLKGKKFNPKVKFNFDVISIIYLSSKDKQKINVETKEISIMEEINGIPRDFLRMSPQKKKGEKETETIPGLAIDINLSKEKSISKSDIKVTINSFLVYYYPELNLEDNWITLLTELFTFEIDPNVQTLTNLELNLNDTIMMLQIPGLEYCGLLSIKMIKFETEMNYPTIETVYNIYLEDLNLYLHNDFKDKDITEEISDIKILEVELKKIGFKKFASLNTQIDELNFEIIINEDVLKPNIFKFSNSIIQVDIHRDSIKIFGDLVYSLQEKQKEVMQKEKERILKSLKQEDEEIIIQTDKSKPVVYEEKIEFFKDGLKIIETIQTSEENLRIRDSKYQQEKSKDSPLFKTYFSSVNIVNLKFIIDSIEIDLKFLEGEVFSESVSDDHYYLFSLEDIHVDYELSDYSTEIKIKIQNFLLDQFLHQKKHEILKFYSPKKLSPFPNILDLELTMINKEKKLSSKLTLLPLQLSIEPNLIQFFHKFSKGALEKLEETIETNLEELNQKEAIKDDDDFIIEHFTSDDIKLVINWVPDNVNFKKIFKGKWIELFNLSSVYGVKISLKSLNLVDMNGFTELFKKMKYHWVSTSLVAGTTTSLLFGFGPISQFSGLVSLLIFEPITKTKKWIKLAFAE
eukprot:gene4039-7328_t